MQLCGQLLINLARVYLLSILVWRMQISCERCNSERWALVIHEINAGMGTVVYSALKRENCGMVYPLQEPAKGRGMGVSKDAIVRMLKTK